MTRYGFWALVWGLASPAAADEYTDTIALFKQSPWAPRPRPAPRAPRPG